MKDGDVAVSTEAESERVADADDASQTSVTVVHKQWAGPLPTGTKRKVVCRYVVDHKPRGVTKASRRAMALNLDEVLRSLRSGKQHTEVLNARGVEVDSIIGPAAFDGGRWKALGSRDNRANANANGNDNARASADANGNNAS